MNKTPERVPSFFTGVIPIIMVENGVTSNLKHLTKEVNQAIYI
jgi:hypothetical protein